MKRTKANFKALRERVGLSQGDLAELASVTRTTVKRWERPGFNDAPADVWQMLEDAAETQRELCEQVAEQAATIDLDELQLTYWRSQGQFDALGRDNGPFAVANANARAIWQTLEAMGVEVEFAYPDDDNNIYHQTGEKLT